MTVLLSESKIEYSQKQIDSWRACDLTQKEFCIKESINPNNFNYWQRQLKKQKTLPKRSDSDFIPIQITPESCDFKKRESVYILHCRNGRRVEIPQGFNEKELCRLLRSADA